MGLPWIRKDDFTCKDCGKEQTPGLITYLWNFHHKVNWLSINCEHCYKRIVVRLTHTGFLKIYKYKSKSKNGKKN